MVEFVDERDYREGKNVPRSVERAFDVVRAAGNREIDWVMRRAEIELACEVLCDAPGGDPATAFKAIMAAQPHLRQPQRWEKDDEATRAVRRACDFVLMAEVAHRNGRYKQAVVWAQAALQGLESAAWDRRSLLRLVASSKRHPLAAATTAVIGIYTPALRRATYPDQAKAAFRSDIAPFVPAYLASGRIDSRSHALGTQELFRESELMRAPEARAEGWISPHLEALFDLAERTRGKSKRSLATAPLVAMERLRALDAIEGARAAAAVARERLIEFGLPRHLQMVDAYGYLDF
jgi:hypothetical protein